MIIINIIFEFFKIGLLSIGGGYATIPFLNQLITEYGWYTLKDLSNMTAISMLTPGPVGVNMATFAGFKTLGIFGGIIATLALVLPSYILIIFISKILKVFRNNSYIMAIMKTLKPTSCALICSVMFSFIKNNIINTPSLILLISLLLLSIKLNKNPLFYFFIAICFGLSCKFFQLIFI